MSVCISISIMLIAKFQMGAVPKFSINVSDLHRLYTEEMLTLTMNGPIETLDMHAIALTLTLTVNGPLASLDS